MFAKEEEEGAAPGAWIIRVLQPKKRTRNRGEGKASAWRPLAAAGATHIEPVFFGNKAAERGFLLLLSHSKDGPTSQGLPILAVLSLDFPGPSIPKPWRHRARERCRGRGYRIKGKILARLLNNFRKIEIGKSTIRRKREKGPCSRKDEGRDGQEPRGRGR